MSHKVKGILIFATLTENALNNRRKDDPDAKYSGAIAIAPNDPQVAVLQGIVDAAKANKWPTNAPSKLNLCFDKYSKKVDSSKDYYRKELADYYLLTFSDPNGSFSPRSHIIDAGMQPITDPAEVFQGAVVWVNIGLSAYSNKTTGIGAWLNGVMVTNEEPPLGRLDNKPTVDQMFGDVAGTTAPAAVTPPPSAPGAPPAVPAAAPEYVMTDKAGGATRQQFLDQGWTDTMMIEQGYMLPPGGVVPSFA